MLFKMDLQTISNSILSTMSIKIVKAGSITFSRLSDSNINSTTISDSDRLTDHDYLHQNKSLYHSNFKLFLTQNPI